MGDNIDLLAALTAVGEQIICKTLDANTLFCSPIPSIMKFGKLWGTMATQVI